MFTFIANIIFAQRNAREIIHLEADLAAVRARFRNVVSHATGGASTDIARSLNDIGVEVSKHHNRNYNAGMAEGARRAASAVAHLSEAERKVLDSMLHECGRKLATIATETGVMDGDVRAIVRVFVQRGLAEFGHLVDDEGALMGRGYCLTDAGHKLQVEARRRALAVAA